MAERGSGVPSLDEVDVVFAALGHEVRRHIVLLLSHLGGELPSGWLAARFPHSWPTTTRHLNVLESAGIIEVRRTGRSSHYRLNRERLERVVGGWMRHLEPPTPEKTWEPTGPRTTKHLGKRETNNSKAKKKGRRT
jgi:DNA-binding transcriptional ArsR family regulator